MFIFGIIWGFINFLIWSALIAVCWNSDNQSSNRMTSQRPRPLRAIFIIFLLAPVAVIMSLGPSAGPWIASSLAQRVRYFVRFLSILIPDHLSSMPGRTVVTITPFRPFFTLVDLIRLLPCQTLPSTSTETCLYTHTTFSNPPLTNGNSTFELSIHPISRRTCPRLFILRFRISPITLLAAQSQETAPPLPQLIKHSDALPDHLQPTISSPSISLTYGPIQLPAFTPSIRN